MKKMKTKRFLSLLLALAMSLSLMSSAFAKEVPTDESSPEVTFNEGPEAVLVDDDGEGPEDMPVPDDNEGPEINEGEGNGIDPFNSYIIVDDPVTHGGSRWNQPVGYSSYRVWVHNTSDAPMTVTVKYNNGMHSHKATLAPGEKRVVVKTNGAVVGEHIINFTTNTGTVSGIVRVRVSDTTL
jgi:hypothetical protein